MPQFDHTTRPSRDWLHALQTASNDLRHLVDGLSTEDLSLASRDGDWTVAQVLSHLGSAAEICTDLVRRGLAGDHRGPQRDELTPIWDRWNDLGPAEQRLQWQRADAAHLELLAGITVEQEKSLRVPYFAGPMDLTTYLGYRLSEHALHGWDVAVTFDPSATVGQLDLVWQRIDMIASRFHDGAVRQRLAARQILLLHSDHRDLLVVDDEVHIETGTDRSAPSTVTATSDVTTRLVYGRLRPEDDMDISGPTARDDLVQLFPGF
ncbi:hypothetical protein CH274_21780 [Rhodococcus sp. 06-418-5]|uniref:maleylpyruvate isomerase N-terminal domain-containing protein n=1 Tax=Rhodococcus sp. 06-418-5 TaxID=2022507 RepID=UPI000B9AF9F8|nr:maleylpyruvate isomerase N-terminal domain-containing protein [Rhodococcus sp. 06-418-5]OZC74656.1 hypothetical protein CH274_21780 [Rhodococcus sp. 06-418-5]